ncbi:MAG TPA: LytTR family DNA-binding domain-containing protein [Flavobacteriales bacterium]|nr:LytTR family DNA-binding domain-containing protein [Flavobacteriales bacterium]
MKAVVIDDEKNAVISIEIALKDFCPEVEVVGTAVSAKAGIEEIRNKKPDLVFLDIQMPHMTGIEMLEVLGNERDFDVIFITAYNDYAIKAFRLSATDYLLKPLNITDLVASVKRLLERKEKVQPMNQRIQRIKAALSGKLAVPGSNGTEFIALDDIIRLEAEGSYTKIFCSGKKQLLVSRNLKEFQTSLEGEPFFRTHKSHLINFRHIVRYSPVKDGGHIEMSDGSVVDVARTQKAELAQILQEFIR